MRREKAIIAAMAAAGLAMALTVTPADAVLMDYTAGPGLGIAIPDSPNPGITNTISVSDVGTVNSLTVEVALDHTWVGDLIFTLEGPDGTTITLMDRPGVPATTFGDDSNLSISFPILFDDTALTAAENAGVGCGGGEIIGSACPGTFAPDDPLATFVGNAIFGNWTLGISDNAGGDTGTLDGWTLHMNYASTVPEPASLALVGLGLVGLGWSRRRLSHNV